MGLVESRRPVILVVEDEFLLRMDAAVMIAAAGFAVVILPRLTAVKFPAAWRRDAYRRGDDSEQGGRGNGQGLWRWRGIASAPPSLYVTGCASILPADCLRKKLLHWIEQSSRK